MQGERMEKMQVGQNVNEEAGGRNMSENVGGKDGQYAGRMKHK